MVSLLAQHSVLQVIRLIWPFYSCCYQAFVIIFCLLFFERLELERAFLILKQPAERFLELTCCPSSSYYSFTRQLEFISFAGRVEVGEQAQPFSSSSQV
jgi:hypothetical protein